MLSGRGGTARPWVLHEPCCLSTLVHRQQVNNSHWLVLDSCVYCARSSIPGGTLRMHPCRIAPQVLVPSADLATGDSGNEAGSSATPRHWRRSARGCCGRPASLVGLTLSGISPVCAVASCLMETGGALPLSPDSLFPGALARWRAQCGLSARLQSTGVLLAFLQPFV